MTRPLPTSQTPRVTGSPQVARPLPAARGDLPVPARKPKPDPRPLRLVIGLTGLATASALLTAFLSPATGAEAGTAGTTTVTVLPAGTPDPVPVRHIVRYVQLKPGQTAPPKAVVKQAPAPKPRVVVVTTKQSGKP